jgi:hypothetical protein
MTGEAGFAQNLTPLVFCKKRVFESPQNSPSIFAYLSAAEFGIRQGFNKEKRNAESSKRWKSLREHARTA